MGPVENQPIKVQTSLNGGLKVYSQMSPHQASIRSKGGAGSGAGSKARNLDDSSLRSKAGLALTANTHHLSDHIRILTVKEVSDYLRVNPSTIYRLLRRGGIPAFKVGSDWRFDLQAIDNWRQEQSTQLMAAARIKRPKGPKPPKRPKRKRPSR